MSKRKLLLILSLSFGFLLKQSTLQVAYADQGADSFGRGFADAINDAIRARQGQPPYQAPNPNYYAPPTTETSPQPYCVQWRGGLNCLYTDANECKHHAQLNDGLCVLNPNSSQK